MNHKIRHLFWTSLKKEPLWSGIVVLMGIFLGISWGANTLFTQRLFDIVQTAPDKGSQIITALISLGGINLINQLVNCIGNISHDIYQSRLYGDLGNILFQRIRYLDLVDYEDTDQLDRLEHVKKGWEASPPSLLIILLFIGFYFPYCLFMLGYLVSLSPWLALLLPLSFLPTLAVQLLRTRSFYKLEKYQAPLRRETEYYRNCISDPRRFKEIRSLNGFTFFIRKYQNSLGKLMSSERNTQKMVTGRELVFQCITASGYIGSVAILLLLTFHGTITLGAFSAVFTSMNAVFSMMEEIVFFNISELQKNVGLVSSFAEFISADGNPEETKKKNIHKKAGCIDLKNVWFSYPEAHSPAIKDFSLCIRPGEIIALVGENGSGKSTLVSLLLGLYPPSKGRLLHNGISLTEYGKFEKTSGCTCIFQNFQRYKLSLMENVAISQSERICEIEQIQKALLKTGTNLEAADLDLYTILSHEFGGTDLSGGEWQKIAMARGIFRHHDLIVMDEPTASIDPLKEAQLYKLFTQLAKGNTMVVVTHRLSSVQFADRILVLKAGEKAEEGTHKELLEKKGIYFQMYQAQKEWYQGN